MKWMIASDLHGSAKYCRQMVEAFEREGADRLLLLVDDHLNHCVKEAIEEGGEVSEAKIAEASAAIARLVKS